MRFTILLAGLLFAFAAPAAAQDAQAEPAGPGAGLQLRPSVVKSFTPHDGRVFGIGLGLELRHFPNRSNWRWGPWAETRYELEGAWRVNGGLRVGYGMVALEVGAQHRTASDDYARTTGFTVGTQVTLGPLALGYRLTLPVRDVQPDQGPALAVRGVEHTILLSTGWSFDLIGRRSRMSCGAHGHGHGHR
ncbi:MAG: hypothetical protein CMN30_20730 [Sandaracinus sp.]|nr:hypothetical protein [Sandaracinus sp.]|tara:strand:- start:3439 stop:4008 length:570 start_codon:yes stop_codon:yes gene_type:complete